ncbi:DUF2946 domain-containing protein [Pseudomonas panipatensis]|uniref:DUF2946 domain-containing protein n=1 Tax=Pseudomonas panipatensis TaxID=428992 RepID=A0A1G8FTI2_9PSED|nr:DUF2946 domain-containing protein [Pseudomonas panipatensis]SDH85414.1 Protein of unknown function [Pseudomonas panipatensis]SMP52349.1 Protein of unknown function [Pseudomonas panipatensis]
MKRSKYVWLACFAVLFNLLAMPLCRSMPAPQGDLVLWGGFCSATGQAELPLVIKGGDRSDSGLPAAGQQQGSCCCTQASGAAPLAAHYRPLPPLVAGAVAEVQPILPWQPSHLRWPRLNPRASPLA